MLVIDQASKVYMTALLQSGRRRICIVEEFFYLGYVENTGAAFGMFQDNRWPLTIVAIAALFAIWFYRKDFIGESKVRAYAMGLIVSGICGNLIDRIRFGAVIDFLEFWFGSYHYPNFNVADSAICIGVILYLGNSFFSKEPPRQTTPSENPPATPQP